MAEQQPARYLELVVAGRVVGTADVRLAGRAIVRAALHVEAGHHPVGVGARLVDAVLALPEMVAGCRLEATVPLGETDSLERLRACCDDVRTHPAGATCLVDATVPGLGRPGYLRPPF
jgi:hypothetical protein